MVNVPINFLTKAIMSPVTLTLFFSWSLFCLNSFGQGYNNVFDTGGNLPLMKYEDSRYEGILGSPFFNDDWVNGEIVTTNGSIFKNILLKYDTYRDELLFNDDENEPVYLTKEKIVEFTLKFEDSVNVRFIKERIRRDFHYYRIVYDGSYLVLEELNTSFIKVNEERGYSENRKYDAFKTYSTFYALDKKTDELYRLKTNPSKLSKFFPDNRSEVKHYIVENELDCNVTSDLSQVFSFYDGL